MRRNPFLMVDEDEDEFDLASLSEPEPFDLSSLIREQPKTDEYLSHLRNRPRPLDYPSSTGRKIGGSLLSALLGSDFGVSDAPIRRATEDWMASGSGLEEESQVEQKGLSEQRLSLKDIMTNQRAQRKVMLDMEKSNRDYQLRLRDLDRLEQQGANKEEIERQKMTLKDEQFNRAMEHRKRLLENVSIPRRQQQDRLISPTQQRAIHDQAYRELGSDPRFSKWYNLQANRFMEEITNPLTNEVEETIDEQTKRLIQQEILKKRAEISKKRQRDYGLDLLEDPGLDIEGNPFDLRR